MTTNESREPEPEASGQCEPPARKPWHEPRFVIAGASSTDAQGNGGQDGATSALSQS
jgi:hypothetical protein